MAGNKELSLGELVNLQTNLDRKTRNKLIFHDEEPSKKVSKKRTNKNRPREESSKVPVKPLQLERKRKLTVRDPRFDSLCGTYNEKFFQDTYSFLNEVKQRERRELEMSLTKEVDPEKKARIKFLLKRFKDQDRENERKKSKEKKKIERSENLKKTLMEGKPVHFKTKSEKRLSELVDKYEELKSKGKVKSFLKKKLKKNRKNDSEMPF